MSTNIPEYVHTLRLLVLSVGTLRIIKKYNKKTNHVTTITNVNVTMFFT